VAPDAFTWRDGERLIRFGSGALAKAPQLLRENGFDGYVLLTTERASAQAPGLVAGADAVVQVPAGRVDEISAELVGAAEGRDTVALGGGRVVDTGKAIAGATGARTTAIPTTLSGAEMTPFHRTPRGAEGAGLVRPALVVADPELMATRELPPLAASAMNALAHAMESLYTPLANPLGEMAALRAAALIGSALPSDDPDRSALALGAVLAGYASGTAGIAVHHATCQTLVRVAGSPHAETNAVMLPHFAALMAARVPGAMGALADALGDHQGDPEATAADIARLAARSGHTRLSTLGVDEGQLPEVVEAVLQHPALGNTPDPPGSEELLGVLERAL
jgi:alcohol dehydrogenase class IV